ncbi:glycosyltransferase family 4 protein [soil metagenome]
MSTLLSINNYFYRRGGAEVVFLEQNRLFEEIGWTVAPFCMQHEKNLPTPWSRFFVDEIEFGQAYSLLGKVGMASKIAYSFEAQKKIKAMALELKPSVAHAHNVYHHISPSIFATLKGLGIPTILTLHDLKVACPAYKMLTHDGICERCKGGKLWNVVQHRCLKDSLAVSAVVFLESALHRLIGAYSRHVDRFVVPSRFYIDKLVEWGWPREKFVHVPNFVDVGELEPEGSPGRPFVFVGRLAPEKGLLTFVKAVAAANVQAQIVGTGPQEDELKALVRQTGADVEFLGYRSGSTLFEAIRRSRALVLPSEWYENAPMSVLEAYALERPVLGANIGGIPELIRNGETGGIFESGNVESLAACLRRFDAMPDAEILAMGKAGREWVSRDFTAERYRDRLLALYADVGVAA